MNKHHTTPEGHSGVSNAETKEAPIVMASSHSGNNSIFVTQEEAMKLKNLMEAENMATVRLANMVLELDDMTSHVKTLKQTREDLCVQIRDKYDLKLNGRLWHIDFNTRQIIIE